MPAAWDVYPQAWRQVLARLPADAVPELDVDRPSHRLVSFLAAADIPYVNLLPGFRARTAQLPPLYFTNDGHWTATGHRLAADLLADSVAALLRGPQTTGRAAGQRGNPARSG